MPATTVRNHTSKGEAEIRNRTMTHKTGTRKQWLAARLELLKEEKELTRRSDELARRKQENSSRATSGSLAT